MELAMTVDERLENIARNLDMLTKIHLDNDREYHERFREIAESFATVRNNFEIVLDSIKRLEVIATSHDQRLDDLEGQ
jgi:hypothetical protein